METTTGLVERLARLPVFAALEPTILEQLALGAVSLRAGETCSTGEAVCVVEGRAEITLRGAPIGTLGAGDLLWPDRLPAAAIVTAVTDLRLVPLPAEVATVASARKEDPHGDA